jgi:hypothetical protein
MIVPVTVRLPPTLALLVTVSAAMFAFVLTANVLVVVDPLTVSCVSVPRPVIFGWFAVVIVPLIVPAVILFVTVRFVRPPKFAIVAVVALKLFVVTLPLTVILLKLPSAVILSSVP